MTDLLEKTGEALKTAEEKAVHAVVEAERAALRGVHDLAGMAANFLKMEAAGGILLVICAIAALIVANTGLYGTYHYILYVIDFRIGFSDVGVSFDTEIRKPILLWINDGLMAIFFFLVGLEIKREVREGELASRSRALLPAIGAVGGMAVPALVFWAINRDAPQNLPGWAIPSATDIAFALGVLALLGPRVPASLKVLLTAIAIFDDLGAIVIIALFYSSKIVLAPLIVAAAALAALFILNRRGVSSLAPYIALGLVLWISVLESGVHATLAGVATAFFIPMRDRHDPSFSPVKYLEHDLHPLVAFGILPVFAFANAGVPLTGMEAADLAEPLPLGLALGLFLGKQVGVFGALALAVLLKLSPMPQGVNWAQMYGLSVLCGIGFTMSLFIGTLAFHGVDMQAQVRMGVLIGSVASALLGFVVLRYASGHKDAATAA